MKNRAEREIRSLKRILEEKRIMIDTVEGNFKNNYKTSVSEGELWSKEKFVLQLNDKRMRLSRSVQW